MGGGRDARSGCGWLIRNLRVSSSRFNEMLISCVRIPADCCWRTVVSSSSLLEGKKSEGWFGGVLGKDSGWEGSRQLRSFEVEMVAVHEGTTPISKLDLCYVWSWVRGKSSLLVKGSRYEEGLHLIGSRGSYTRDFLGKGQGFEDTS